MKAKTYVILEMAIEEGIRRGYRRAFKYQENPPEEDILDSIENCVMAQICEYFTFDNENENS